MKRRACILVLAFSTWAAASLACSNPLGIPTDFEIETTSELGPDTLARIDDVNDILERGMEIGPETRETIEELNETVRDGIEFGFTEESLSRVDRLLSIVEQGVGIKVGLDDATNATVNELIDTIDEAPDQWEDTATQIIETLEGSTSAVAGQMADEIRSLMTEARLNTQYVTAAVGIEFRCNVDFLGARAGDTVNQFIGRSIIGRLRSIISGRPEEPEVPVPWVCQIIPDQIDLVEVDDQLVFQTAVVKISGYNYVADNAPIAYIVDEAGERVESTPLYPFLSSPYQIQLNLQSIDFSAIPERSRVRFEWPAAGTQYELAMVLPTEIATPEVPTAELTISSAAVDVRRGPSNSFSVFGRLEVGTVALVTGRNGDSSWWQIDIEGDEGWVPSSAGVRNEIEVPVVPIPYPLPVADFRMTPEADENAPREVAFTNRSTGDPNSWEWDFGDGQFSIEQNPTHAFVAAGTYQVRLTVENDLGSDSTTRSLVVTKPKIFIPWIPRDPFIRIPLVEKSPAFTDGSILFRSFPALGDDVHFDTGLSVSTYDCGIIGLAAMDGDIHESGIDRIVQAQMYQHGETWWVQADFHTHENDENWHVGVMCVNRSASEGYVLLHERVYVEDEETKSLEETQDIPDNYHCGVAGFGAFDGDINENWSAESILKAFVQEDASGEWQLTVNFWTHEGPEEYWNVDVLCVYDYPEVFFHRSFNSLEDERPFDTNVSSADYACGIDGFAALGGDLNENDTGAILRAYTFIGPNQHWFILADFRTHYTDEWWDIQLLCVRRPIARLEGDWSETWVR